MKLKIEKSTYLWVFVVIFIFGIIIVLNGYGLFDKLFGKHLPITAEFIVSIIFGLIVILETAFLKSATSGKISAGNIVLGLMAIAIMLDGFLSLLNFTFIPAPISATLTLLIMIADVWLIFT